MNINHLGGGIICGFLAFLSSLRNASGSSRNDQIMQQRTAAPTGEFQLGFTPSAPVDINYEAADLTINYEMDKLNFDLKIANGINIKERVSSARHWREIIESSFS